MQAVDTSLHIQIRQFFWKQTIHHIKYLDVMEGMYVSIGYKDSSI